MTIITPTAPPEQQLSRAACIPFSIDKTRRTHTIESMNDVGDPIQDFIEAMGLRFQDQQVPRIAGRLYGLLMVEGGPLGFGEIAERLQVSRGSVSQNTRLLVEFGLIERVALSGKRQDHYRMAGDGLVGIFRRHIRKIEESADLYARTAARIPPGRQEARERLAAAAIVAAKAVAGLRQGLAEAESALAGRTPG